MNNVSKFFIFFVFCIGVMATAQSQKTILNGSVFLHQKGLKKVWVSNGDTIVKTDKKGRFSIPITKGQVVFPILPSGYAYSNAKKWWYHTTEDAGKAVSFSLQKITVKKKFKFLAIGDVQVGDTKELLYATQSVLAELLNRQDYDFSIYLGDLVNDAPNLFAPLKSLIDDIPKPSWVVYGNHDRNFKAKQNGQFDFFRKKFGPENHAFFKNEVLFVSLNSITPVGKYGYQNQYPPNQLRFFKQLLQIVPKNQQIVISQHVPLVAMKNQKELMTLLAPYKKILVLSGHTHTVFQNKIEMPSGNVIHELTAGAVSGNWWTGQKKWEGVPLSLMSCGTPRGYFEINFDRDDYKIQFKGVNLPKSKQFTFWAGDYNAEPIASLNENHDVYLNVFSGSNQTTVTIKLEDEQVVVLEKVSKMDPFVNYIKKMQRQKMSPDANSKAAPYLRTKSHHLWTGKLPVLERGFHNLEVIIKDPKFTTIKERIWVYKE